MKKYLTMKTSLKQQKIHFETIIIYTFKQNEMTKKLNKILMTTTKKMLLWSNLFKTFWSKIILIANYILNWLSAKKLNDKILYKMWHNKKSLISHMKIFKCLMYTHIFNEIHSKMNKMFETNIFVDIKFITLKIKW